MGVAAVARQGRVDLVLVALVLVVVAQVGRILFPVMFEIGEDWDFLAAGIVALAVFAAPIVALPFARFDRSVALIAGSTAAGAAFLVAQFLEPIPAAAAMALVAVALAGGALVIARLDGGPARGWFVFAVLLGLALDVAIRAISHTWDLAWQTGSLPRLAGVVLVVGMLAAAVVAGDERASRDGVLRPVALVVAGAIAAIELLFLANVGFVSSQADLSFAPASAVVLTGLLVAVLLLTVAPRPPWPGWLTATVAVAAIAVAWILPTVTGAVAALLVVALQVAVGVLFFVVVGQRSAATACPRRAIGGAAGGSVLFLMIVLLWQLHIDQPLPFPRQAVPALAVAVIALPALRSSISDTWHVDAEVRAVVVSIAALVVAVPAWLWVTSVDPADHVVETPELRLVSYNVRGAVDIDGQLRPDRVIDEIRTSNPHVVVLQEVGRGWPIHGTIDLLVYLSHELDMEYLFAPAADGQFGNAILSSLPMDELASGRLPKDGAQERSYLMVELTTSTGPVTVVDTHLQTRSVVQVAALLDAVGGRTPVVVAGDMNIQPTDPEVALFTDVGLIDVVGATGDPCRTTSAEPTSSCNRPDWVFVSPDIALGTVRIGDTIASDHLAIHASLGPG